MYRWIIVFLGLAFVVGCGPRVEMRQAEIPVSGKLTVGGNPGAKLQLNLHPMEGQHPVWLKVGEDGTFSGKAIAGKYSYFVDAERSDPVAMEKVGTKFREADLSRTITVSADKSTIDIALD
jgi:hypothetical protein